MLKLKGNFCNSRSSRIRRGQLNGGKEKQIFSRSGGGSTFFTLLARSLSLSLSLALFHLCNRPVKQLLTTIHT